MDEDFRHINQDDKIDFTQYSPCGISLEYWVIVSLVARDGEVVYDGPSDQVTPEILGCGLQVQAIE